MRWDANRDRHIQWPLVGNESKYAYGHCEAIKEVSACNKVEIDRGNEGGPSDPSSTG